MAVTPAGRVVVVVAPAVVVVGAAVVVVASVPVPPPHATAISASTTPATEPRRNCNMAPLLDDSREHSIGSPREQQLGHEFGAPLSAYPKLTDGPQGHHLLHL